jgi:hypothetical protein
MQKKRATRAESARRPRAGGGAARGRQKASAEYERGYDNGGPQFEREDDREVSRGRSFAKRVGSALDERVGGMDIDKALVLLHTALAVAIVIKQTRDRGPRRKAEPFRSAMSVLNYYLNEGRDLSEMQRATLEDIKEELRMLYNREDEEMMSPAR